MPYFKQVLTSGTLVVLKISECETKEKQRTRNASTDLIKSRIQLFSSYFPKLNNLQNKLEKLSDYPRKRSRNFKNLSDNNNPILNEDQVESKVDIGIQVDIDNDYNLTVQIDALKSSLANVVTDHAEQLQAIQNKNYKILELEHECESLKKQVAILISN
ncbi:23635_t:CDS:2 [Gigaspora rosea]|nr:23635_t:CDS:2 [Gigaspora rosea]